jgi:hypothetical protein
VRSIQRASGVRLFGSGNEDFPESSGVVSPADIGRQQRDASFYLYIYTRPPSYTLLFIEALMAGTPILAPSPEMIARRAIANDDYWTPARCDIKSVLNGGAGFLYDSVDDAIKLANTIQSDMACATQMSEKGRTRAIETFGVDQTIPQWNDFLMRIC